MMLTRNLRPFHHHHAELNLAMHCLLSSENEVHMLNAALIADSEVQYTKFLPTSRDSFGFLFVRADRVTVEAVGEEEEEDAANTLLETSLLAWASDWAANVLPGRNLTIDAANTT